MRTGDLLDERFRLSDRLGAGGMSVVWRAHDDVLDRDVAVKVLSPGLARDPQLLARVRSEARAVARLRHPNVVDVYDYGEARGPLGRTIPYVVMEVVEGRQLSQLLTGGALPWRLAVVICAQVAAALAAAHARGVVHRDVKPGNVMVGGSRVKLVDFGISAAPGEEDRDAGQLLGTPAYLAPERLEEGVVRPATDVYALGLLLYRTLAGHLPWQASTATQMLLAHRYQEPAELPDVDELPAEVRELCRQCLKKDPEVRPTAAEVAAMLGDVAGLPPDALGFTDAAAGTGFGLLPGSSAGAGAGWAAAMEAGQDTLAATAAHTALSTGTVMGADAATANAAVDHAKASENARLDRVQAGTNEETDRAQAGINAATGRAEAGANAAAGPVKARAKAGADHPKAGLSTAAGRVRAGAAAAAAPVRAGAQAMLRRWEQLPRRRRFVAAGTVAAFVLTGTVGLKLLPDDRAVTPAKAVAATGGTAPGDAAAGGTATGGTATGGTGRQAPRCTVGYTVATTAHGRFAGRVSIANTGQVPIKGARLTFTMPGPQKLTAGTPGTWRQSGRTVSAKIADLPAGRSSTATIRGTYTKVNALPDQFRLNETVCRAFLSVAAPTTASAPRAPAARPPAPAPAARPAEPAPPPPKKAEKKVKKVGGDDDEGEDEDDDE
ncbi:serine/threonine-protein kinase [Actinoplanes sp. URMC 104]|uniref:serine/threonine-protein kinase n=1 Tax=Actinoplanes sp. URMC 104 TaxID=3423409 RepID=UPI003F1C3FC2